MKFLKKHKGVQVLKNKKLFILLALAMVAVFVIAGCGSSTTTEKKAASTDKKTEAKGLTATYKESVHYTFFAKMIAKGPSIKDEKGEHYSDFCMACHSGYAMLENKAAKVDDFFPGGKYADKVEGITCKVCHSLTGKDGIELTKKGWDTCGQCHITGYNKDGSIRKPALGSEIHHPQLLFVQGIGVGEVADTPSTKYGMKDFSCQDCHVMNDTSHTFMVPGVTVVKRSEFGREEVKVDYTKMKTIFDQKKCQTCHSSNAQSIVDKMKTNQEEIGKKEAALKKTSEELATALKAVLNGADGKAIGYAKQTDPKAKAYLEGMTYLSYVEADSSRGAHNYAFAKALLEKADASFKAAK